MKDTISHYILNFVYRHINTSLLKELIILPQTGLGIRGTGYENMIFATQFLSCILPHHLRQNLSRILEITNWLNWLGIKPLAYIVICHPSLGS